MQEQPLREICNVALLGLTGATCEQTLDGVGRIANVATILVPESLLGKLMAISMQDVAATVPIPDGKRVRVMSGQVTLSGEALANTDGPADEVLVVVGQLVITTPVQRVGFAQLISIGQVIAPVGSETALGAGLTRMTGQIAYYPYTPGAAVQVLIGTTRITGADLANPRGQPTDILIALGPLVIVGSVDTVGYQRVVAVGHVLAPRQHESALAGYLTALGGQIVHYSASPRIFDGKDSFSAAFFELLEEPVTLALNGRFAFEADVSPELLKGKVAEIVLHGKIVAPHRLVPMLQILTVARDGRIVADDDAEA
jgi:hypothetical protein